MPKGNEEHRNGRKKAKYTLKERRQLKREKKQKDFNTTHEDVII